MNSRIDLICLWSGYAFFPLYLIGFVLIGGFIPIISPNLSGAEVAVLFEQGQSRILIGMSLCVIVSALIVPWCVAIFGQMSRMETGSRALSYVQLISGSIGAAFFMIPSMIWATMAFRTGHNPDTLLILNDFAWIAWVISWPFFAVQEIAIGFCILLCQTDRKVIPRWVGYFAFWSVISLVPASLVVFFKTGLFAWNGLIAVYLPLAIYGVWYNVLSFVLLKALKGQLESHQGVGTATGNYPNARA